jgi:RND family efflux transporter MFP subunit
LEQAVPEFQIKRPASGTAKLLALAALVLLASCGREPEAVAPEVRPVRSVTIASSSPTNDVSLTGRLQARAEVNQSFRLPGQLIQRFVDIGDQVRVGHPLARLDSQNEQSGLQAAQAQLVAAQVQLADARNNFNRMRNLIGDNAVSRASYDHSEALLRTAEAQVIAVRSQLELAQNRVNFTRLNADVAGVVTARGPEVGEVVAAGQMIVQIAQAGAVDAVFDVPALAKDTLTRTSTIWVALLSDPGIRAKGTVRELSPRADPVTGTFRIRISVANPPPAMRLGSTITGTLRLTTPPGISLPTAALVRAKGGTAVWIVDPKTSTVGLRTVTVGSSDTDQVRVNDGLNPGDIVVTAGVQVLRPGQKVSLLGPAK